MTWVDLAFWVFAAASVWFGWRVFATDSMLRASFALLMSFLNVGAIMLLLLGEYLGAAVFFMMTIEMTVMAIFMIAFMMNPAGLNPMKMVHQERFAIAAGVGAFVALTALAVLVDWPSAPIANPEDTIRELGHEVMSSSMLVMQTVGVTLMTTMVGAVILTARSGRFGDATDASVPPPLDPDADEPAPAEPAADPSGGHHHH